MRRRGDEGWLHITIIGIVAAIIVVADHFLPENMLAAIGYILAFALLSVLSVHVTGLILFVVSYLIALVKGTTAVFYLDDRIQGARKH